MNLVFLILISFISLRGFAQESICGKITSLRGKIEVLRFIGSTSEVKNHQQNEVSRKGLLAENKMKLWCSDILLTREASRAVVRLKNQTIITLGPHSRVEIQNYLNNKKGVNQLKLTYGKVRALFKNNEKESDKKQDTTSSKTKTRRTTRLLIRTPGAVAGVRGTDFYLSFNPLANKTEQATLTGEVEVENTVTGEKVSVEPGQQVSVNKIPDSLAEKIQKDLKQGKSLEDISRETGVAAAIAPPSPIGSALKTQIQQTSSIAQGYKEFSSKEAIAVIGKPETWKPPVNELPFDLKDLKEEF